MKNLQDFFLFCSGVESSVLEKCPTDRNKYAGIGATVFFTGVLAFFSSGMEQEVFKQQEDRVKVRYQTQIDDLRGQALALKAEITAKTAYRDSLAKIAVMEADGTGGSRKKNLGPIYRAKKDAADQAQIELNNFILENQPLIREKELAAQQFEQSTQKDIAQLDRGRYDGFAARLDALSRLADRSLTIFYASIFITLLFVAVETAPILVKLISYRSPYDFVLDQQEQVYQMAHLEQTTLLSNSVKNKLKVDTEVGIHRADAEAQKEKAIIDQKRSNTLESLKNRSYDFAG
jgi:hypothetical protein